MQKPDSDVRHFSNRETILLSEALHDHLNLNYETFKELLKLGAIYINKERQVKDKFIIEDSLFRVHTNPKRYHCDFNWKSLIIFENDFFLVLNKPPGLPSHATVDNLLENALAQTSLACKVPLYVTHRLDTLTSGLIVYAKKRSFVKSFNIQLQERSIEKKYVALIETTVRPPSVLTHYMDPSLGTPKKMADLVVKDWPECKLEVLEYKIINSDISLVKINLLTGKTHQIRAQLAHIKAPVLGDVLYGSRFPYRKNAIALKSYEIEFNCEKNRMKFTLNEDFDLKNFKGD